MNDAFLWVVDSHMPAWVAGMSLLFVAVLKLLWGADMVYAELKHERPYAWASSGEFWLGNYFLTRAVFFDGLLGFSAFEDAMELVPAWFTMAVLWSTAEAGLAWYFLSRERRKGVRG